MTKPDQMLYRFISWMGQKVIQVVELLIKPHYQEATHTPEWAYAMAARYTEILDEFLTLYDSELREFKNISSEQSRITSGNAWRVFVLKAYGRILQRNTARCPITSSFYERINGITSVMFSVLEPGTVIIPHRGPYSGVLRCHIPLIIPSGDCGLRVGEQVYRWKLGDPLVFDDTLDHEAWNKTGERRVVLFIDFIRPLPWLLSLLNRAVIWLIGHSPFIVPIIEKSK